MLENSKKNTLILTGGGSGGHLAPIRAVVPELQKKYTLFWIGASHFEKDASQKLSIPFKKIFWGKMRRGKSLKNFILNIRDIFRVLIAFFQSLIFLLRKKPKKIFSTGGFVSVPVILAGASLRIPIIIHEQTIGFGLANKIALPFAKKILLAFEDSKKYIPKKYHHKVEVVGNPIRSSLVGGSREELAQILGREIPKKTPILYITGGGQGAEAVNEVIWEVVPELKKEGYIIIHQVGKGGIERAKAYADESYFPFAFLSDELKHIYATAHYAIARAGAGTVNELDYFQIPTIFIPLRPTQNDEQTKNAEWFLQRNEGSILHQKELNSDTLLSHLEKLKNFQKEERENKKEDRIQSKERILGYLI